MGMIDHLYVSDGVSLPDWPYDDRPDLWQTKDVRMPSGGTFKLAESGELLRKEVDRESLTEEEKERRATENGYDSWDEWVEKDPLSVPSQTKVVDEWWVDHGFHGEMTFYTTFPREQKKTDDGVETNGVHHRYKATFDRGKLDSITLVKRTSV